MLMITTAPKWWINASIIVMLQHGNKQDGFPSTFVTGASRSTEFSTTEKWGREILTSYCLTDRILPLLEIAEISSHDRNNCSSVSLDRKCHVSSQLSNHTLRDNKIIAKCL